MTAQGLGEKEMSRRGFFFVASYLSIEQKNLDYLISFDLRLF